MGGSTSPRGSADRSAPTTPSPARTACLTGSSKSCTSPMGSLRARSTPFPRTPCAGAWASPRGTPRQTRGSGRRWTPLGPRPPSRARGSGRASSGAGPWCWGSTTAWTRPSPSTAPRCAASPTSTTSTGGTWSRWSGNVTPALRASASPYGGRSPARATAGHTAPSRSTVRALWSFRASRPQGADPWKCRAGATACCSGRTKTCGRRAAGSRPWRPSCRTPARASSPSRTSTRSWPRTTARRPSSAAWS